MTELSPPSRKETYAASMVIFIGLYYLWPLAVVLVHGGQLLHTPLRALWLNMLLPGGLFIVGGVLFFRQHHLGWVICAAAVLQLIPVVFRYLVTNIEAGSLYAFIAIITAFFVLLLLSLVFLFGRETRSRFNINNKSYLMVIVLYAALTGLRYYS